MTLTTGRTTRVIGCEDAQKVGRIQVIAFQSLNGKEMHVTPFSTSSIIEDTADSRETKAIKVGGGSSALEDSCSHSDVNYSEKQRNRGNSLVVYGGDSTFDTLADTDSMDMTPSMQEGRKYHSKYVRKKVPLKVVPATSLLKLEHPLDSFTDLQEVEQAAYKEAISHNIQDGKIHPPSSTITS